MTRRIVAALAGWALTVPLVVWLGYKFVRLARRERAERRKREAARGLEGGPEARG